jgi:DNA modification methylase
MTETTDMLQWETVRLRVCDVVPHIKNPKKWKAKGQEQLAESLRRYGVAGGFRLTVDNRLLDGHGRCEELAKAGYGEMEIDFSRCTRALTPEEEADLLARFAINNRTWDFDMLKTDDFFGEMDFEGIGFDGEALKEVLPPLKIKAKDDEHNPSGEVITDIVPGDLFEFKKDGICHRLLCGDSTDSDAVANLMNGEKADLVVTDPDFSMPIEKLIECYDTSLLFSKNIGFWICGDKQAVKIANHDFQNFAKFFVQDFRNATIVSNDQPMTRHVMIVQMGRKKMNNLHDAFSTLLQIATDRVSETHELTPMSKKVELPYEFIVHYSESNDIVLDFFGHSGSTMVACNQVRRNCFMMELEPKYCQVIVDRMRKADEELEIYKNREKIA